MAEYRNTPDESGRLKDPEFTGAPEGERRVSERRFLGMPAWGTAVAFAALAAVMYLLMLMLM